MKRDGPGSKQRTVADNGKERWYITASLAKTFTANAHLHTVPTPLASLVYTYCCLLESGTPMYLPTSVSVVQTITSLRKAVSFMNVAK